MKLKLIRLHSNVTKSILFSLNNFFRDIFIRIKQSRLYNQIDSIGLNINPKVGCFHDGVAFPGKYLTSKKRIMWVLKNSYDDIDKNGTPISDGMDIRDWFSDEALEVTAGKQIFIKIALASYCIQNDIQYSQKLLSDKTKIMKYLQSIALVDLSKLPGDTKIQNADLIKEFSYFKDIVSAQIKLYAPDIIVFGNTLQFCYEIFPSLDYSKPLANFAVGNDACFLRSFSDGKRLLLEAYHPSYPKSKEDYVSTIVRAVAQYFS